MTIEVVEDVEVGVVVAVTHGKMLVVMVMQVFPARPIVPYKPVVALKVRPHASL
jgi:hypothetical protein